MLPGVFVRAEESRVPEIRIRAAGLWAPEAVVTGAAAARCTFWPEKEVTLITLSTPNKRVSPPGYRLVRERLPRELVRWQSWVWLTTPGLTALDLVPAYGGAGIDRALLTRAATLADMHEALALTPGRNGNGQRRALLHDSRDEPWSEAERLAHAVLRASGLKGWDPNLEVWLDGQKYFVDIAFARLKIAIEIDRYEIHRAENREQFEHDRRKGSALTAAGWRVLRFTRRQLRDQPEWVIAMICRTVRG